MLENYSVRAEGSDFEIEACDCGVFGVVGVEAGIADFCTGGDDDTDGALSLTADVVGGGFDRACRQDAQESGGW